MPLSHKTTAEVAEQLGMTRVGINQYLYNHTDLKPKGQLPSGDLMWTEAEIQALRAARSTKRRPISRKQ